MKGREEKCIFKLFETFGFWPEACVIYIMALCPDISLESMAHCILFLHPLKISVWATTLKKTVKNKQTEKLLDLLSYSCCIEEKNTN